MVRKTVNVKDAANFCADWEEIRCNCHEIPDIPSRYAKVLIITNVKNWLIGPYDLMCEVAEKLRWDETKKSCVDPELLKALTMAKARYGPSRSIKNRQLARVAPYVFAEQKSRLETAM